MNNSNTNSICTILDLISTRNDRSEALATFLKCKVNVIIHRNNPLASFWCIAFHDMFTRSLEIQKIVENEKGE